MGGFLIVDDDPLLVRSLTRDLSRVGEIIPAFSVAEARGAIRNRGDAIWGGAIVDLHLLDGLGWLVVSTLRERSRTLPIVLFTGYATAANRARAQELRVAFMAKPYESIRLRTWATWAAHRSRRAPAVERWRDRYELTEAEADVFACGASGIRKHEDLAWFRGVKLDTSKQQASALIGKTRDASLADAAARLAWEEAERAPGVHAWRTDEGSSLGAFNS